MSLPIFGSPRQALAYLYAHHRGPTLARPRYDDAPPDTGRSHLDASAVGALLYGPRGLGHCGVLPGGDLDDALRAWATSSHRRGCPGSGCTCTDRSDAVRAVERRLRMAMRAARMLPVRVRAPRVRRHVEPDGAVSVRVCEASEQSRCVVGQDVAMVP